MAATEEPILSRIDRLDNMLRQLEVIRGCNPSPKSSCASTPTSGSDGHVSSTDFSPKSLEKHCRPIEFVMMETEVKGTMIERLNQVEDRMLKLEEELVAKKKEEEKKMNSPKKGFKQLVKQCVKARGKYSTNNKQA
ncbi:hypothetical protein AAZX31_13G184600 [Glycine max]|uniref:Uncharacterized protein n=2 Tax=Glycine subgen. Soja TaxID=1462606 RepID=I1M0X9_SOYBN|nr:uncharacterized protein LOC100790797 isoform X2 [Glycine max]XP_028186300.1 uncharacterized protein LOC114372933 isoform X2 [Glycine soja]KAG4971122.1 hypothetical protein JHK85_037543 [Glycine max]KAG4977521.1 hypothetical protein JHK86_036995 [Glycine max]KAG5113523.1 hypothetical protein JHK82_036792 [Glycine max]KAG5130799.1 hypothetical protein JHK84_037196 [Glycine max]KAH1102461.1 hypothetical protein GYH30_036816 [Glycine max]|eukprot:XP_003542850.1 uncharacterized protein LOC100790797 isoform X2 [Glycine max]